MNGIIHTEMLTKRFRRVSALNGLDLSVPAGAVYAFVGPNGAGKTTAIKILMNIIRPTAGRASVLGLDSRKIFGRAFTSIGYASENQQLPGWMRVGAFLNYLRHFYPTWDLTLEAQLVKKFDLPIDRKLRHLSRGMRMKAALASGLAFRPKLVVLDEPFSGLDPLVRDELSHALQRPPETTVFISSHDLAEVESFATHVGYLETGRLRFSEEMASLSARFREVELILEIPPHSLRVCPRRGFKSPPHRWWCASLTLLSIRTALPQKSPSDLAPFGILPSLPCLFGDFPRHGQNASGRETGIL